MNQMNELQCNLFQLLVEFDEICKKHDIEYLLAAGASLGAIRNRRFMPWDDDIDLYITRDNWNKLRHVFETQDNVLPEGRSLVYKENTPYYCNPLPRYINNETTNIYISQALAGKSCGQHIELFIFDPIPNDEKEKEEYLNLLHVYTELLSPYFIVNKNASLEDWQKHYELYVSYCRRIDAEGEEKVIGELEDTLQKHSIEDCDQYCMRWGIKNYIYDKELFEKGEPRIFEGRQFPMGCDTESILRVAYGDSWMYIPEYEQQVVHNGLKDSRPFKEYTNRYMPKINRQSVFKQFVKNKRNNASTFYNSIKVEMLAAKQKAAVGSIHIKRSLEGKEDYLRNLLENKDYEKLSEEFDLYNSIQLIPEVIKHNIWVPVSDKNLATLLFALVEQGKYYDVNKYLKIRKLQEKPLSDELIEMESIVDYCRNLSIARYDKKDESMVQSILDEHESEYSDLLDSYRAELWIKERNADSKKDYELIDEKCSEALSLYPFDGEIMAIQAKAKLECGDEKEAMELYEKAIHKTRNGLVWQKVEDETGISRIDIESKLIEELNNENQI